LLYAREIVAGELKRRILHSYGCQETGPDREQPNSEKKFCHISQIIFLLGL